MKPEPETPAETPVAHRLCLNRLSTLPSPSWPIRSPMYSLGLVLYRLLSGADEKRGGGGGWKANLCLVRLRHGGFDKKERERAKAAVDRLGGRSIAVGYILFRSRWMLQQG